jgi:hypothetical protein
VGLLRKLFQPSQQLVLHRVNLPTAHARGAHPWRW